MFTALQNVQLSHLADKARYNFQGLKPNGAPVTDGDKAFDEEIFEPPIAELLSLTKNNLTEIESD
jgi:tRNA 2-thiocytidine biosynthesis protein TtcA